MDLNAPSPVCGLTKLTLIDPDGTTHVLGRIYWHRNAFLTILLDTPLRWMRDRNIRTHNARMARHAAKDAAT